MTITLYKKFQKYDIIFKNSYIGLKNLFSIYYFYKFLFNNMY